MAIEDIKESAEMFKTYEALKQATENAKQWNETVILLAKALKEHPCWNTEASAEDVALVDDAVKVSREYLDKAALAEEIQPE